MAGVPALADLLKLIDSGAIQIIGVEDLIDQRCLHHDLGNIGNAGDCGNLFIKIAAVTTKPFSGMVCEFDAI